MCYLHRKHLSFSSSSLIYSSTFDNDTFMLFKPALYFFDVLHAFLDLDTFRFIVYLNTAKINTVRCAVPLLHLIEKTYTHFRGRKIRVFTKEFKQYEFNFKTFEKVLMCSS